NSYSETRKLATTALFRLAESYRKQGKTNEAVAQYQRVLQDFADQPSFVDLSRQELATLGHAAAITNPQPLQTAASTAESERITLQNQIEQLKKLSPEQRRVIIQQQFPNPVLTSLLQKLGDAEEKVRLTAKNYGSDHQEVRSAQTSVDILEKQIDSQI